MNRQKRQVTPLSTRSSRHHYKRVVIDQEYIDSAPIYPKADDVHAHDCYFEDGSLSFLRLYPNLQYLWLTGHGKKKISLSGIENCPQLRRVSIMGYHIENAHGIEFCTSLGYIKTNDIDPACLEFVKECHPRIRIEIVNKYRY